MILRTLALSLLLAPAFDAQLSSQGRPASFDTALPETLPVTFVERPDVATLLAEDEENGPFPFRYGTVEPVTLDAETHGLWEQLEDGTLVWRAEIAAAGAHSLGVLFGSFDLPAGGELYAYAPDRSRVIGAFTEATEQPNGMLALQPFPGDRLVLEYVQPSEVRGWPSLTVESVVYDYRNVLSEVTIAEPVQARGPGCLVDVNCGQGQPYQDIKRSVVGLFRGGFVCSGSLLNNTAQDGTPYLFTADHCGDFTNGSFLFNYERPGCDSGMATMTQFLSGAQLLKRDSFVDAQLYRLNQALPAAYEPFLAGWNRAGSPGAPVVGISHPAGFPKKIQIDNDPPVSASQQRGVLWDLGEIRGGSSGSPLFDSNQRVIGPLCCGAGACRVQTAFYGKFDDFYSRRSLAQYLDPLGTGATTLDGYDPFGGEAAVYNGSGSNPLIYGADVPVRGATWNATVDTTSLPAAVSTILLAHAQADAGLVLGAGEVLIDLASPLLFRSTAPVAGTSSAHSFLVANDPALVGAEAFSQALVLGGGVTASNGVRLRVQ